MQWANMWKKNDFDHRRTNASVIFFFNKENLKFLANLKFTQIPKYSKY